MVSARAIGQVICSHCLCQVLRGGTVPKDFSIMGLICHLKAWHPARYAETAKWKIPVNSPMLLFLKRPKKNRKWQGQRSHYNKKQQCSLLSRLLEFCKLIKHLEPHYTVTNTHNFPDKCLPGMHNYYYLNFFFFFTVVKYECFFPMRNFTSKSIINSSLGSSTTLSSALVCISSKTI